MPPLPPLSHARALPFRSLLPAICGVVLVASSALAQEQDRTLMDRIDRPNMNMTFDPQGTGFTGGKSFSGGKDARMKTFYSPAKFRAKDYMTGSYAGQGPWKGDFTYDTKNANTEGRGWAKRSVREHATKDAAVKESRDANRNYSTRQHASANRTSGFRGKSQDKIDIHGPQGALTIPGDTGFRELRTIDDIRNLLNKD